MNREKEKLYRRDNKLALHYHGNDPGSDFRHERNTKKMKNFVGKKMPIKKTQGGYDYTPLFKFLLSKVGENWNDVHSEAVSRLDSEIPIFHMVDLQANENTSGVVRLGESSQYSRLTVKNGILVKVNPNAQPYPATCRCCTHTFNGRIMKQKTSEIISS